MKKKWLFLAPVAVAIFVALGGESVKLLWNWVLPAVFGWRQITFWQALGMLALCRILFGGFGGHGFNRSSSGRRLAERWRHMTPEEREKFRQGIRSRCGDFETPDGGTQAPA